MGCAYCAVRAESLNIIQVNVNPRSDHVRFVVDKLALGLLVFRVIRFSPVNIIPLTHHTYLNLHVALNRRTNA